MGFEDRQLPVRQEQPKPMPENVITRIAKSINPQSLGHAQELLSLHGCPKATNKFDLAVKLSKLAKKKGDDIIPAIVALHPDRKIFDHYYNGIVDKKVEERLAEHESKTGEKISAAVAEARKDERERVKDIIQDLKLIQSAMEKTKDNFSNSEGKRRGRYDDDCGCSGADGTQSSNKNYMEYLVPGVVLLGVVAVFAFTLKGVHKA